MVELTIVMMMMMMMITTMTMMATMGLPRKLRGTTIVPTGLTVLVPSRTCAHTTAAIVRLHVRSRGRRRSCRVRYPGRVTAGGTALRYH